MDEHRIAGTAKNMGGKVEEGFGRVTGDTKSQVEGLWQTRRLALRKTYMGKPETPRRTRLAPSAI